MLVLEMPSPESVEGRWILLSNNCGEETIKPPLSRETDGSCFYVHVLTLTLIILPCLVGDVFADEEKVMVFVQYVQSSIVVGKFPAIWDRSQRIERPWLIRYYRVVMKGLVRRKYAGAVGYLIR